MTDTPRPRRSALYMPASNAKAIEKARTLACDVVILDLEDAVAPEAKETARMQAVEAVKAIESGRQRSEEGAEQVQQAGQMLQRITLAVEAIRDMNRQIATAAEEQTSVAEDISCNLIEITRIATANQQAVQHTEQAGQRLHGLSGQLGEVTSRLSA